MPSAHCAPSLERAFNPRVPIVFTGFIDPSLPAAQLVKSGRARQVRWKIHPSLSENVETARAVGARTIGPCFGGLAGLLPEWQRAFAPARVVIKDGAVDI